MQAAFKVYKKCLGSKIRFILTNGNSPIAEQVPAECHDKIMHATFTVGDEVLMGADSQPGSYEVPKGFSVTIGTNDPAEAEHIFHALSENGKVQMPIQQTFWAVRFGVLVDQFGIPWIINCEQAA